MHHNSMLYDVAILGAGAAGMMAAVAIAESALPQKPRIAIFEKNTQPGIKVLVCGGGRCNFTNAGSVDFLISQFGRNGRFLTPALRHLDNDKLRDWFANRGVPSHEEHDGKIYPDSNQARSVVNALVDRMRDFNVDIRCGATGTVQSVERTETGFTITTTDGQATYARILLLAMGGMSYQKMGTTGDGYKIAQVLGHSVVTPRPAIVGLLIKEEWPKDLKGLAVPGVEVRIAITGVLPKLATGKPTPSINDMLFTHFGLSGPAVLNVSEIVAELLEKIPVSLKIDLVRGHSHEQLGALFRSWQQQQGKQLVRKMLAGKAPEVVINSTSPDMTWAANIPITKEFGLPRRLAEKICELENIGPEQTCSTLTSAHMHGLVQRLKASTFTVTGTRGFKEAMVTAGGIALTEVDPNSLQSKITPNLYLTGEVLDLTGPSGGYNLQLAFSTGHLAGTTIGKRLFASDTMSE